MQFQSYEIALVGRFCETCDPDESHIERITEGDYEENDMIVESFWTLYGRLDNGQAVAIFDSINFQGCLDIYTYITGHEPDLPTPDSDDFYVTADLPV